jgi:hypothetical protein
VSGLNRIYDQRQQYHNPDKYDERSKQYPGGYRGKHDKADEEQNDKSGYDKYSDE